MLFIYVFLKKQKIKIMVVYNNFVEYINLSANVKEKIARINAIIEVLEDSELRGASAGEILEYQLDDGQTKIRTVYKDLRSISHTIEALESRKARLLNRVLGHRYGLKDGNTNKY